MSRAPRLFTVRTPAGVVWSISFKTPEATWSRIITRLDMPREGRALAKSLRAAEAAGWEVIDSSVKRKPG